MHDAAGSRQLFPSNHKLTQGKPQQSIETSEAKDATEEVTPQGVELPSSPEPDGIAIARTDGETIDAAARRLVAQGHAPHEALLALHKADATIWEKIRFAFPTFRVVSKKFRPMLMDTLPKVGLDPEAFIFADAFIREFTSDAAASARLAEMRSGKGYWKVLETPINAPVGDADTLVPRISPSTAEIFMTRPEMHLRDMGALVLAKAKASESELWGSKESLKTLFSASRCPYKETRSSALHGINIRRWGHFNTLVAVAKFRNAMFKEELPAEYPTPLPMFLHVLERVVKDSDLEIRSLGIRILKSWPDRFVTTGLCMAVKKESDPNIRTELVAAIAERVDDSRAQATLIDLAESPDTWNRILALDALVKVPGDGVGILVKGMFQTSEGPVQTAALRTLIKRSGASVVPWLLSQDWGEHRPQEQRSLFAEACGLAGENEDAIRALLVLVKDASPDVRIAALNALSAANYEGLERLLDEVMDDPFQIVRTAALSLLTSHPNLASVGNLIRYSTGASTATQVAMLEILGTRPESEATEFLLSALHSTRPKVALKALECLAHREEACCVEAVFETVFSQRSALAERAIQIIAGIPGQRALDAISLVFNQHRSIDKRYPAIMALMRREEASAANLLATLLPNTFQWGLNQSILQTVLAKADAFVLGDLFSRMPEDANKPAVIKAICQRTSSEAAEALAKIIRNRDCGLWRERAMTSLTELRPAHFAPILMDVALGHNQTLASLAVKFLSQHDGEAVEVALEDIGLLAASVNVRKIASRALDKRRLKAAHQ